MFTQCCISEQADYAQQISGVIKCEGNLIFWWWWTWILQSLHWKCQSKTSKRRRKVTLLKLLNEITEEYKFLPPITIKIIAFGAFGREICIGGIAIDVNKNPESTIWIPYNNFIRLKLLLWVLVVLLKAYCSWCNR